MQNLPFGYCSNCFRWGLAPAHFKERIHFLECPVCSRAMFLTRATELEMETIYGKRYKVDNVGVMLHNESN